MLKGMLNYFREPKATQLDFMRAQARVDGRIAYDCFNAIFYGGVLRVKCQLGHHIGTGGDGGLGLITVLSGKCGIGCHMCQNFDNEEKIKEV